MAMIEGVGDEVVQFMLVVMLLLVGLAAWWSTNARPGRYRTVVVMRPRHPVTVNFRSRPNLMIANTPVNSNSASQGTNTATETIVSPPEIIEETRPDADEVIPLQEMDSIIDADMAMMNNNRLHFYRRINDSDSVQGAAEPTSEESEAPEPAGAPQGAPAGRDQMREMDSIVSAMEADVAAGCDFFTRPETNLTDTKPGNSQKTVALKASDLNNQEADANAESQLALAGHASKDSDHSKILIRLKYLNDTLKEVEANLDELLSDFTWRHFSVELSAESRVRLIFHGRVLEGECTLRAAGLHHRAVVHALVHPRRPGPSARRQHATPEEGLGAAHELAAEGEARDSSWELENVLMTLVSVALTVVWFFRCEYSNIFTASASVALFGLTVFYSVAVFGLYLTDTFQFERRAAQPQAMF